MQIPSAAAYLTQPLLIREEENRSPSREGSPANGRRTQKIVKDALVSLTQVYPNISQPVLEQNSFYSLPISARKPLYSWCQKVAMCFNQTFNCNLLSFDLEQLPFEREFRNIPIEELTTRAPFQQYELCEAQKDQLKQFLTQYLPRFFERFNETKQKQFVDILSNIRGNLLSCEEEQQVLIHIKGKHFSKALKPLANALSITFSPATKTFYIRVKRLLGNGSYKNFYPLITVEKDGICHNKQVYVKLISAESKARYSQFSLEEHLKIDQRHEIEFREENKLLNELQDNHSYAKHIIPPFLVEGVRKLSAFEEQDVVFNKHFFITNRAKYSIEDYLSNHPLNQNNCIQVLTWFVQILKGVTYLHSKGRIHLDLKPDNFLVTDEGDCQVGDLGLSQPCPFIAFRAIGTLEFINRKSIITGLYNQDSDYYSLGVCFDKMIYKPFKQNDFFSHVCLLAQSIFELLGNSQLTYHKPINLEYIANKIENEMIPQIQEKLLSKEAAS